MHVSLMFFIVICHGAGLLRGNTALLEEKEELTLHGQKYVDTKMLN